MQKRDSLLKKRFLIVGPGFLEWDLGTYLSKLLLDKNIDCREFGYESFKTIKEANRRLLETARVYKPDIIVGLKMDRIEAPTIRTLRRHGIFVALWNVDCFTEEIPAWIKPLLPEVDLFLTTAEGMTGKYSAITSAPVHWIYEGAYLPAFPRLRPSSYSKKLYGSQVAFIGHIYQPPVENKEITLRRARLFRKVGKIYDLKVWGQQGGHFNGKRRDSLKYTVLQWPAYNNEVVKICQASDIILGINTVNTVRLYFSNRTFLTLASGGFHITHYVPGLETMFENHKHLVWFKSDMECLDLIAYYLKRPRLRTRIAQRGRTHVRKRYGMNRQVNKILNIINNYYV